MKEEKTKSERKKPAKSKSKPRSPSYPGINLEQAIERTKIIYERERRHETAENTILEHWGYNPKSGPGIVTLAALKAFGLLEVNKDTGKFKVTDLAERIILDTREDDSERVQAISTAALNPPMHKVIRDKYGDELPSESSLRYFLMKEKNFTQAGAGQFISQYRETLDFVHRLRGDKMSEGSGDERPNEEPPMNGSQPKQQKPDGRMPPSGVREIPIPISGAYWPTLKAAFPLSEDAWDQMLEVLKAMKPGLVKSKADED